MVLAAKKSSRTAAEGFLAIAQDEKRAAVVELNCETDFVARNDVFQCLVCFIASNKLYINTSYRHLICLADLLFSLKKEIYTKIMLQMKMNYNFAAIL
jgi:translation elongation factor EF-Ts